ncbi:hypothetical protein BLA29_009657 [Euroglyphus maynei]|uniref:Uncharacterized protein n=1 Tax=Euroglyphus maynei TaxID=6958 RepID=A0A1Y3BJK1_EURMA|nr:hypothetical protein BLA29_009657 [Euroglyphus maynei]
MLEDKLKILGRPGSVVARMIVDDLKLPITVSEFMKQFEQEYSHLVNVQPVPLMPGVERLIRHLNRFKIPIAIATGSRRYTYELNTKFHQNLFESFHHVLMTPEDPENHQNQQQSSQWSKPYLMLDSLKLFQPELFGLPPFLDDC